MVGRFWAPSLYNVVKCIINRLQLMKPPLILGSQKSLKKNFLGARTNNELHLGGRTVEGFIKWKSNYSCTDVIPHCEIKQVLAAACYVCEIGCFLLFFWQIITFIQIQSRAYNTRASFDNCYKILCLHLLQYRKLYKLLFCLHW